MADAVEPEKARAAEVIAQQFHETYEWLAPAYGYKTREESACEWEDVPETNRKLMIHVVGNLIAEHFIAPGLRFGSRDSGEAR